MTYNAYANYPYSLYTQPQASYASYAQQPQVQQQPAATPQIQSGIIWVDGEVGAKAQQLPAGWPANTPLPLWDTNDTIIYLKSINQMGMPNPLQKLHYTMEEMQMPTRSGMSATTPMLMSGDHNPNPEHEEKHYVTKDDLERMKEEIRESITEAMNSTQTAQANKKGGGKSESSI